MNEGYREYLLKATDTIEYGAQTPLTNGNAPNRKRNRKRD